MTTRRNFLTTAALAAVLPVPTQAAFSQAQTLRARLRDARIEFERHEALYQAPDHDEEYHRHFAGVSSLVNEIEHISIDSVEALKAKIDAAEWCNDILMKPDAETTDYRLVCQIMRAVQAA